jgi:hypothetical protein
MSQRGAGFGTRRTGVGALGDAGPSVPPGSFGLGAIADEGVYGGQQGESRAGEQ